MLLEEHVGKSINEARIRYHQDNVTVRLNIDEAARNEVLAAIGRMRELRRAPNRPPVTENEKLCRRCSLRVVCLPEEERLAEHPASSTSKPKLFPAHRDRRTLHVTTVPSHITRSDRTLVVETDNQKKKFPIEQVDSVLLYGGAQISSQAVHLCAWEGIGVQWISGGGRVLGTLSPPGRVRQRLRQYQALTDPEICLKLARQTVYAKIQFQLQYLMRGTRTDDEIRKSVEKEITSIRDCLEKVPNSSSLDNLRGLEGFAAKCYFKSFSSLLNDRVPASLRMVTRTKHPPRDRINCLLSFGYSLIFALVHRTLVSVGLEPALGYFHQPRTTAPPLVLDVMEIFRTLLWEMPLVGSLNRGQWREDADFEVRPGHVWLSDEGRKKAIAIFESRLAESYIHPHTQQSLEYGRMVELEIRLLEKEWTGCPGLFAQLKIR
jgi:CRISPR-associated protein Cas1